MEPNWTLADDRKSVLVTFPSTPPVALKLDALEIDSMLSNLAEFRAQMADQHPKDFALGQKVVAVFDPLWATELDALLGDSLLHFRHPGFGWLHFLISKHEAVKLAGILQVQAEAQPEPPLKRPT